MISDKNLLKLIWSHTNEGCSLDYKEQSYIISLDKKDKMNPEKLQKVKKTKRDLIIDIAALANTNGLKPAFIITGVKEIPNKSTFERIGIKEGICKDHNYQELLKNAVKPSVSFNYNEITENKLTFGFFIIIKNFHRPYFLNRKDDFGDFHKGTIPRRLGSTNQIVTNNSIIESWKKEDKLYKNNQNTYIKLHNDIIKRIENKELISIENCKKLEKYISNSESYNELFNLIQKYNNISRKPGNVDEINNFIKDSKLKSKLLNKDIWEDVND